MFDRKAVKRKARQRMKKHYWIFMIACLLAFMGIQYTVFSDIIKSFVLEQKEIVQVFMPDVLPAEILTSDNENQTVDVLLKVISGNIETGRIIADEIAKENIEVPNLYFKALELGYRDGIFAKVANAVVSGQIFVSVFTGIDNIVGNDSVTMIIFIVICLLIVVTVWALFINSYRAVYKRIFLEGRVYDKLQLRSFLHFLRIKKYFKAVLTMFLRTVFKILWTFTVAGGFIKHFSYFLVPYIVAENPEISPLKAINLSKNMMNGHKMECFKLKMSFIGWYLLDIVTLGLAGVFFVYSYDEAFFAEYYAYLREIAKKNNIKDIELLNDEYLFKKADSKLLSEKYSDITELANLPKPKVEYGNRILKFFADFFGVVPAYSSIEQEHFEFNSRKFKIESYKDIMNGQAYPERLNPVPEKQKQSRFEFLNFKRHYSIASLTIMFFIFSFAGWFWEMCLHIIIDGEFVNRGILHGPWLPIYGSGCVMILLIFNKLRANPALLFGMTLLLCGVVEYFTATALEMLFGCRWWDYNGYFFNINGRVSAEGLVFFGIGGMTVVYFAAPILDNVLRKIRFRVILPICIVLVTLFTVDIFYSFSDPNKGKGITDYNIPPIVITHKNP